MSEDFETYWQTASGQRIDDFAEVERLANVGVLIWEVSADQQREQAKHRKMLEAWHAQAIDRHAKFVAEQAFKDSPEGKRAEAIRQAQEYPGGIVTSGPQDAAFFELDQYSPPNTNKLR